MPCWDHKKADAKAPAFLRRGPQQAMIHGLFPLRGVPLKLPASLRSETNLHPLRPLHLLHPSHFFFSGLWDTE